MALPYNPTNPWITGFPSPIRTSSGENVNAEQFAAQAEEQRRKREAAAVQGLQTQSAQEESDIAVRALEPTLATREKFNAQAEQRRLAALRGLMSDFGSFSGSGGAGEAAGGAGGGQIGFDEGAARSAAFARAKDRAGQTSRAALDALRNALSSSGRLGGDFEAQQTAGIIGGAAGELGEFEREQLIQDLIRAGQISDRESAAALARRGQDLQRQAALMNLFNANLQGPIY